MTTRLAIVMFALCVVSAALSAQVITDESAVDLATYRKQQQQLQKALAVNDPEYADLTSRQRTKIREASGEILALLEGRSSYDQLAMDEKARLYNAQQQIQVFLIAGTARAEREQDACWQERKLGSRIMKTRCATGAEREQAREGAQGWLIRPKTCVGGEACGDGG